jgi:hypothetical protein
VHWVVYFYVHGAYGVDLLWTILRLLKNPDVSGHIYANKQYHDKFSDEADDPAFLALRYHQGNSKIRT